ncbi:MAG: HEPN domain-containing protein [bacterium]
MKKSEEEIELVNNWLRFAKENLLFARSGMEEDYAPYHTICFLCQGSAEKYLKAYLIFNGWELKKTHDLEDLLAYCGDFDSEFLSLKEECSLLNEYVVEARYPGDLPFESITGDEAKEAVEAAGKIETLVIKKVDIKPKQEGRGDVDKR